MVAAENGLQLAHELDAVGRINPIQASGTYIWYPLILHYSILVIAVPSEQKKVAAGATPTIEDDLQARLAALRK